MRVLSTREGELVESKVLRADSVEGRVYRGCRPIGGGLDEREVKSPRLEYLDVDQQVCE